jgi:2-polyprenyl-3-methyl-5-hydroxy-6-metoxy-1,4-benzoquinol methylase
MEGNARSRELVIPASIPPDKTPDLLKYWYLGSRARRYISRRRLEAVTDRVPAARGQPVLDVGCGAGLALALLGRRGFRPVGIDLVADGFHAARCIGEANGLKFRLVNADVSRLPFRPSTFRAVTAVEMLEHVFEEDRRRALAEMARVISPGGTLVLSTPNYGSFVEIGKRLLYKSRSLRRFLPFMHYPTPDVGRTSYHPHRYHLPIPPRSLRALLEDAAFTVVATKKFLFALKYTPDRLFRIVKWFESILERLPLVRELACTVLIVAVKAG